MTDSIILGPLACRYWSDVDTILPPLRPLYVREYWRSKLSKQGAGNSPRFTDSPHCPPSEGRGPSVSSRINFKDFQLSAEDFASDDEDGIAPGPGPGEFGHRRAGPSSAGGVAESADAADKMQMMRTMSSRKGAERSKVSRRLSLSWLWSFWRCLLPQNYVAHVRP